MAVSAEEMKRVKSLEHLHEEVLRLYLKEGSPLVEIAENLGFGHSMEVSAITRAYGLSGGSERGKYKGTDDSYIKKYVDRYSPGFEYGDKEVTFKEFLGGNQQSVREHVVPINTRRVQNNDITIPNNNLSGSKNINRQQTYQEDTGINLLKLVVPIILIFCIYKVIVGVIFPAIGEGVFKTKLVFQKQSEMQAEDLKKGSYFGETKGNNPNGYGSLILNDSSTYIGEFKRGKMHNRGILLDDYHTPVYIGEWSSDQYNGFGMLKEEDGSIYIGEFSKGKKHGVGVKQEPGSSVWTIRKYSRGTCKKTYATINSITKKVTIKDTKNYIEMGVSNGILVGQGKNKLDGLCLGISGDYLSVGYYHKNKPKGHFVKLSNNGDVEYGNNQKKDILDAISYEQGQGIILGDYKNTYIGGYGMEYMENGDIFIGNYKKGQRNGKGTYIFSNRESRKVIYKKGVLVEQ